MRNGVKTLPLLPGGTAPAPPNCGLKNREVTLENTNSAENPWMFGTLTRPANAGILELCHSIGNVSGVAPKTPKSYALWVYFQTYSPEKTRYRPTACCSPTWNSLRQPGLKGVGKFVEQTKSGLSTGSAHPLLESIRFSLKGVSRIRAYDARSTVLVFLT